MSEIRVEKLMLREASRMGAPLSALKANNRCGYGVFDGAGVNLRREQWCATKREAEALAREWEAEPADTVTAVALALRAIRDGRWPA